MARSRPDSVLIVSVIAVAFLVLVTLGIMAPVGGAGPLLINLFWAVILSGLGAIFLRAGAKWVAKVEVPFPKAYLTFLLPSLALQCLAMLLLGASAATGSSAALGLTAILLIPLGYMLQTLFTWNRLRLAFGHACLVVLVAWGLSAVFGGIVALVMKAIMENG